MGDRGRPPTFYVAIAGALAVGACVLWASSRSAGWPVLEEHLLSRATGWCAAVTLLAALTMTPLSRALRRDRAKVGRVRRALGITAAVLASLHATLSLRGPLNGVWESVLTWPYLRAGLSALVILLALLVTSFPRATRALGVRVWKPLHRLSYAAGLLVLFHLFHGPFAPRRAVAAFAIVLGLALAARLLPRSSKKSRSTPEPR